MTFSDKYAKSRATFLNSTHISICIATHRRARGLEKLLGSLVNQKAAPPFNVIVVDNDREKSGETVALQFKDKVPLTYLVEPVRGIARARNRAVAAAQSPFLAFIDDDEWAAPQWLAELDRSKVRAAADIVIGRVEVQFDTGVSELVRHCGLFDTSPLPDGATVPWYYTRTSNAYVRRDALPDRDAPFSKRFDLMGGEDVHLFKRMIESGARVVAAEAAIVFEYRPAARANSIWVFRRAMRNGGTVVELDWSAMSTAMRLRRGLRCGYEGGRELFRIAAVWNRDRAKAGQHLVRGGEGIGKLLYTLGIRIEEFRRTS
jgi:succinoglycan biosynthesis protein ExoM